MKNLVLAVALATALFTVSMGAHAASSDELAHIRQQLEALIQRVDRLEQENNALKAENQNLKAAEQKQPEKRADGQSGDWTSKVAITGDLRYRYEATSDETLNSSGIQTADRYRDRIRARLNATVKATDSITLGIGMATAEDGDPRSSNQSLNDVFSRKGFDLDLAYFDWRFARWGHLIGGKMKQPFVKPGQSLFWDNDINPEGLAVDFSGGAIFGTAYNYWLNEESGPENTATADTMIHGLQIGTRLPLGSSSLMFAAHYYDLSAGQGRAPFFDDDPNGNSVNADNELIYDYQVINLSAEYSTELGELPMQLWADVAQNQDPGDLDTAWSAGVLFGKASNDRTWELGALYQVIEKDALFAQLIDSDFGAGVTDTEGWVLRAGYAPVRNSLINATYFLNKRNADAPNSAGQRDVDYERLQLDFSVKF